jgi:magnesium transporter
MSEQTVNIAPWEQLDRIIDSDNVEHLETFLHLLPPEDTAYTLSHLEEEQLSKLILSVRPELAAQLIMHLADAQAADVIEELPPQPAAAIVDELGSDDQADVLAGMDAQDAEAILTHMDPQEAADARRLVEHEPDTAGGIMITEYLAFTTDRSVAGVLADLRHNVDEYAQYDVQYVYVTDAHGALRGNVRLRDLVLAPGDLPLEQIMRTDPVSVDVSDELEVLDSVFDRHPFEALPAVDDDGRLVGVVHRGAVEEAYGEESDRALMRFGGIIGGEELRSMRLLSRGLRRFAFLVPNIVLLLLSISVIWAFEAVVLAKVTSLFMFLPLSGRSVGLCGQSGGGGEHSRAFARTGQARRCQTCHLEGNADRRTQRLGVGVARIYFGPAAAVERSVGHRGRRRGAIDDRIFRVARWRGATCPEKSAHRSGDGGGTDHHHNGRPVRLLRRTWLRVPDA